MELLGEGVMWNLVLVHLETVSMSLQYRCTVCAEHTIGQKLFWMHPMVLLGDEAQVETRFSTLASSANIVAT
jgi:hypothetical protein